MERWRSFFGSSGEDLWTVIDRALTIAAIDYPQELRVRRDGFAEKLFAPAAAIHNTLASSVGDGPAVPVSDRRAEKFSAPNSNLLPLTSSIGEAPALTGSDGQTGACSHSEREDRHERELRHVEGFYEDDDTNNITSPRYHQSDALTAEMDESRQIGEILTIKGRIMDLDQTEETTLASLKRLEDMHISVPALKATGIGKPVNGLRKHASRQIRLVVKRLVSSWKDIVDVWVKKEGEDAAVAYVDSGNVVANDNENQFPFPHVNDDGLTTAQARSLKMSQMLDIRSDEFSAGSGHLNGNDQQIFNSKLEFGGMHVHSDCQAKHVLPDNLKHSSKVHNDLKEVDANCQGRSVNSRMEIDVAVAEEKLKTVAASCRTAVVYNCKEPDAFHRIIPPQKRADIITGVSKQKLLCSKPVPELKQKCPESAVEMQRFEAAKRRLHEGYQQAEYAKKQRTVQVLDMGNLPKVGQGQGKGTCGPLCGKSGFIAK